MKLHRAMFFAVALASATATAQSKQTPAQPKQAPSASDKQAPAEVTPAEAKNWMTLFDKVVDAVVTNREHCPKMATGINAVVDANLTTIAMARDAKAKGKRLPTTVMQQMAEGARRMVNALDKCGRDQQVGAAFARIDLGSRK